MGSLIDRGRDNRGYVLLTVLILTSCASLLVFGMLNQSMSWMKMASRQEAFEEALFVADGGCQNCLAYIMEGKPVPATLSGTIGGGTYSARVTLRGDTAVQNFTLCSTGIVRGVRRVVTMDYVHSRSWAEYAMWYDNSAVIYFQTGDRFRGKMHCNCPIYIADGQAPIFEDLLTCSSTNWGDGPADAVFLKGYQLGVPDESMSSINFTNTTSTQDCLRTQASLVLTGATTVVMAGTNFFITNSRRGWSKYNYGAFNPSVMTDGVVYVATSGSSVGDLSLAGTLDGRLTIVTDGNINITNHIRYAANPTNVPSNDALGLISRKDIIVKATCPRNLDIFAHLIAEGGLTTATDDGMFTVENYTSRTRSSCQNLNVYGGIVQRFRGAVGTSGSSGTGYLKNYMFDTRFATNPPPHYPVVGDRYYCGGWRDSP